MTSISALNGGLTAYYANLSQTLFNQIDSSGGGSITKSELESAVTAAGGTTASADALYAKLDPNGTGSVSESQFANTVQSLFSPDMSAQLISVQEQLQSATPLGGGFAQQLFSQIAGNSDGTLTKAQLEQAVTKNGGTTQAADALWAQLDPSGASSITEQQFAANLPQPGSDPDGSGSGNGVQDAMAALLKTMPPPPPPPTETNGASGSTASNAASGNTSDANSALSALQDLIQAEGSSASSTSAASSGNSAQDALLALLDQNGASGTSLLGNLGYGTVSQWLQPQSGNSVVV
jgi:Ca2+-binding EF-hand superfamily protein